MARQSLNAREQAFWHLVDASHVHHRDERGSLIETAAQSLTPDEVYGAISVISLFNFYNKFVDLGGVDELTAEGYDASGVRLSTMGYAPPPVP